MLSTSGSPSRLRILRALTLTAVVISIVTASASVDEPTPATTSVAFLPAPYDLTTPQPLPPSPQPSSSPSTTISSTISPATTPPTPIFSNTEVPCDFISDTTLADPRFDVICGYVTLPQDHTVFPTPLLPEHVVAPAVIELHYAQFRSTANTVAQFPLFFLDGGPGSATLESLDDSLLLLLDDLLGQRDVVFFDQRGIGLSTPELDCPTAFKIQLASLAVPDSPETERAYSDAMRGCATTALTNGVEISSFNTTNSAADIAALASILDYDSFDVLGVSYGTFLAQALIARFPSRIHAAVLDSVVPLTGDFTTVPLQGIDSAFSAFFAACDANPACAGDYPDLEQDFYQLVEDLDKDPLILDVTLFALDNSVPVFIDGNTPVRGVFIGMYDSQITALLPAIITAAAQGNESAVSVLASLATLFATDDTFAGLMGTIVRCRDITSFDDPSMYQEALDGSSRLMQAFTGDDPFLYCNSLALDPPEPYLDQPAGSTVPMLTLSGGLDPITPPYYARQVATAADGYAAVFPALSHTTFSDPCVLRYISTFLDDRTFTTFPLPCSSTLDELVFAPPFDI